MTMIKILRVSRVESAVPVAVVATVKLDETSYVYLYILILQVFNGFRLQNTFRKVTEKLVLLLDWLTLGGDMTW